MTAFSSKVSGILFGALLFCALAPAYKTKAQTPEKWSARMAATLMAAHADSFCYDKSKRARWDYELGLFMKSVEALWRQSGDGNYYRYIQKQMDFYIQNDGQIRTYDMQTFNIDHVAPGRAALLLWQQTGKEKYRLAAQTLREQLARHPRTKEGGFWHKKRYPWQMWLDGLYMAQPFYAEYSLLFNEPQNFDDIANQFIWMEKNARDPQTGLLYHAWDESREQGWADKNTGRSPHFWGRAMGWYAMALADALDYFPKEHPKYGQLTGIFQRLAVAVVKVQDAQSGVWYQVPDRPNEPGNYREASASCMFAYALLKGVRLGHLDAQFQEAGKKAYSGILKEFMLQDADGSWHLDKVCSVAGLGGNPYRDGSFQYYISEPVRRDDLKGAGPFILASLEMERLATGYPGKEKTVLLDRYFNNEYQNGERYHYIWEDIKNPGFFWWGQIFRDYGAQTTSLDDAPTAANLENADVYIIVDPDTHKETANPHFIDKQHTEAIKGWVKNGGTLVLLANDTANCEIPNLNRLAGEFGMRFSDRNRNMVKNNQFEQGAISVPPGNPIFSPGLKLFIKEISILDVQAPARPVLSDNGDVIMATADFGKGRVFALGDPWLYNEYVDGKKLPAEYQNYQAARDLSAWLLQAQTTGEADRVGEAVENLRQALLSGEKNALDQITHEALSYGHSGGSTEDKKSFMASLTSGRSDFTELTFADQSVTVSENVAIVRHRLSAATNDEGKGPGKVQLSVLLVWVKQNGYWKLLARQAVKI